MEKAAAGMEEREWNSVNSEEGKGEEDQLAQPSKPWHSYLSEELPRSLMESKDSAIRSARSLQHDSSTHLNYFQDFMLCMRSHFAVYEDAFFRNVKDGVTTARENPTMTAGLGLSAAFLLLRGPRRFLFRHTLGRLQSEEARFVKAEEQLNILNISVNQMKNESQKLLERALLAEKALIEEQSELMNSGKRLQSLASSVDKAEAQAADLMDLLREIPGREAIKLRAEVASVASLLRQQKSGISKRMMKLSDLGVKV